MSNECGLAMANDLKVPVIGMWAFFMGGGESDFLTATNPPSYQPMVLSEFSDNMSFGQRWFNLTLKVLQMYITAMQNYLICDPVIHEFYPDLPSSVDMLANLDGALIYSNAVLDYPAPIPQNFIHIGGMQIKKQLDKISDMVTRII